MPRPKPKQLVVNLPRPRSYTNLQLEQAIRLLSNGTPIRTVAAVTGPQGDSPED